jgi:hypothetical protein
MGYIDALRNEGTGRQPPFGARALVAVELAIKQCDADPKFKDALTKAGASEEWKATVKSFQEQKAALSAQSPKQSQPAQRAPSASAK